MTTTLRIEHRVGDYARWKEAFDSDPLDRKGSGVRSYRVMRARAEPDRITIDLEFEDPAKARAMESRLRELWNGPVSPMLNAATVHVWDVTEEKTL